ncbi:50S ribosomal protein L35 [Candidatus Peregrinibacteria bacterium]|nr:50S ribosomal protein L35 [Candidatus Peregrinibacteria bacterium]MBT4148037.1 50S ribosomal protein L35 [Candidatus Peregrinibacteria bacterium]MBT4366059.1 50S ribosomal protein L35 [Candidatus Peregrinibacteria bacterium]MBT4455562.1 50S ribosomal protein L35 [Candidatus Peregrinibacteria bacterium]
MKKRVKVKKSGNMMMKKSCKNHLLSNKSKSQKKADSKGMAINKANVKKIRKMLPNS